MHKSHRLLSSTILLVFTSVTAAQAEIGHDVDVYKAMIEKEADRLNFPPAIAEAVTQVESGFDPTKIGGVGEVGLMQVRPSTAAMLGFKGDLNQLADPETNIHLGISYLAGAWKLAGGNLCRTLMKYRAGHGADIMTPLSATYCARVSSYIRTHTPVLPASSTTIGIESLPSAARKAEILLSLSRRLRGAAFWAAHDARIKVLAAMVEKRWRLTSPR